MIDTKNKHQFMQEIVQGIPEHLPKKRTYPKGVNQAPKRKDILSREASRGRHLSEERIIGA